MKLVFAGSGSAFTMNNRQSNMVLEDANKKRLLIDCGSDARHSLQQLGLAPKDVTDVYISHLHADHVGGLEWLAFVTFFDPGCSKPTIYISQFLKTDLWSKTLAGGLASIQGVSTDINTFFDVVKIPRKGNFIWENTYFQTVQTVHIMDGFTIVPSFGLMFNADDKEVFITTDTQFCPEQIKDFYKMADVIFHDCETTPFESGVHAHFNKLATLPDDVKAKMWLYHYQDGDLPDAKAHGFRGFVQKHQVFDFEDDNTLHNEVVVDKL